MSEETLGSTSGAGTADPRLIELGDRLEATGWAFELLDPEWRVVTISREMRKLLGARAEEAAGMHILETRTLEEWAPVVTVESEIRWIEANGPYILHSLPGGIDALLAAAGPPYRDALRRIEPAEPPAVWTSYIDFLQGDLPPMRINYVAAQLREGDQTIGFAYVYGPALPASLLSLVARGDERMFDRMARLLEPSRREAAILFADLEASGPLSRRLPSSAFFRFIAALTTAIDGEVIERGGIVGKHAGDGVTAFFLSADADSAAEAAAAAIGAARAIGAAAARAREVLGESAELLKPAECMMNVGVHWGAGLYMGQLVTGGRLEVTALGDEVNECARLQQSARGGAVLASKALVERLDEATARRLHIDPDAVPYRPLGQLAEADGKAIRDAGTIPVTDLAGEAPAAPS